MASLGHSRASSLADFAMPAASTFNPPPGQGGRPGGAALPHIDDILAVPDDIDFNQSIKKLLDMAEVAFRQAEMSREFRRPALALKEYIRASVIAVHMIRKHRDYASLKHSRDDLARAHTTLLKNISQQDQIYAKIKADIIADNQKTGVRPMVHRTKPRSNVSHSNSRSISPLPLEVSSGNRSATIDRTVNDTTHPNSNGAKVKPVIHPKPQALAGKVIRPNNVGVGASTNTAQDLAARFANLRGPKSSPGQDPRIKTHQIEIPRPAGPREMPPPARPAKIPLEGSVPELPKMPDAIYSPARGSISGESTRQPASTPRGGIYRTATGSSVSSHPGTPTSTSFHQQSDYFAPTQSYSTVPQVPPVPPSNNAISIPGDDFITPEELFQAMKKKGSILLIDARTREDFNEGHIMSSHIVCIEPSILLRENVAADQIAESLVLSPNREDEFFGKRNTYDLVVFYDQDSEVVPQTARSSDDLVIMSLRRALVDYNYGNELKNPPKILRGGINAWIDLLGPGSLQTGSAEAPRPVGTTPHERAREIVRARRKTMYPLNPLKPDEVKAWQETLKKEDLETASSPTFLRTTDEFLRRYPPVGLGVEQESMKASPSPQLSAYGLSHKVDLSTDLPSPPTRPPPALPRPSYSGLPENGQGEENYGATNTGPTGRALSRTPTMKSVEQQSTGNRDRFDTGLNNPGNWCYANSALQSLLASPGFGEELADSRWLANYAVPKKTDERTDHPQLMMRIISNLFHWMNSGKFPVMKAQTLMQYSHHLCAKDTNSESFGGPKQQDAQEFMSFLIQHLHDETNVRRDRVGNVDQPNTTGRSLIQAAKDYWCRYSEFNQSIIDHYWRGLDLSTVECQRCKTRTYTFSNFEWIPLSISSGTSDEKMTLDDVLAQHTRGNVINDFQCDHCRRPTKAEQSLSFARMPQLLCVVLGRFNWDRGGQQKALTRIDWDLNDMDFSKYFVDSDEQQPGSEPKADRAAFTKPFRYETYAVILHSGDKPNAGHYYAYVRKPSAHGAQSWLKCDDQRVSKYSVNSGYRTRSEPIFKKSEDVPYMVFFRRKD